MTPSHTEHICVVVPFNTQRKGNAEVCIQLSAFSEINEVHVLDIAEILCLKFSVFLYFSTTLSILSCPNLFNEIDNLIDGLLVVAEEMNHVNKDQINQIVFVLADFVISTS